MPEIPADSPYPLGTLVRDPALLQNRSAEITAALDALAPVEGGRSHIALMGEPHSGRSSVLAEVSRRLDAERKRLVVALTKPEGLPPERRAFIRHMLIALVETLVTTAGIDSPWYRAWRERVYLHSTSPVGPHDLLSSALLLAADPDSEIDQAVLERDLAVLSGIAHESGRDEIVLTIDDASPLTEDVALIEALVDTFDSLGGYALLIAGLPSTADHFTQAASTCVQRFQPVWLMPFFGPRRILTTLRAPLAAADQDLIKDEYSDLLRDVMQLTGGNVYELMIVAHHLWMSCKLGEQDHFVLTPRVLDRIIPHIAMLTAEGDALRDGAEAIDLLPEERVGEALELASLSRLSVREIAITRLLRVDKADSGIRDALQDEEIEAESERVFSALGGLEDHGVVQMRPDGQRFDVVGGRAASVLLKYKAHARIGTTPVARTFNLGFLLSVGRKLTQDVTQCWLRQLPSSESLGFNLATAKGGIGRHSPRPAIRSLATGGGVGRLIEADLDFVPWSAKAYGRIASLLAEDDPAVALVCTSVMYAGDQLEHLEAWEVSDEVDQSDLDQALSTTTSQGWVAMVESAELIWSGSEGVYLRGEPAREALIALFHFGATSAVHELFGRWLEDRDPDVLRRARRVAVESVATLRKTGQSDLELGGELGGMLSRLGFLQSFEDELLDDANSSLDEALRIGPGDGWVTRWNFVNVLARLGETKAALAQLDLLAEEAKGGESVGYVFFFLPGRATSESFLKVEGEGIEALIELQQRVLAEDTGLGLKTAIERCRASGDEGASEAAQWMQEPPALAA